MFINDLSIDTLKEIFKEYPLYSQEFISNKKVLIEFYIPNQNMYWLMTEGSLEENDFIMFGYCHINDSEFGYVSFNELKKYRYTIKYKVYNRYLEELKDLYKI